jgi:transcriptional regulator with XRE-family HTH domain
VENTGNFAKEVLRLRLDARLSRPALAKMIGVNQSFVQKIESGERDRLGADVYLRLCAALGVKCDHFTAMIAPPIAAVGEAAEPPAEKPKAAKPAKTPKKK